MVDQKIHHRVLVFFRKLPVLNDNVFPFYVKTVVSSDQKDVTKVCATLRLLGVNRHNRYIALLSVNDVTPAFVSLLSLLKASREPDGEEEYKDETVMVMI